MNSLLPFVLLLTLMGCGSAASLEWPLGSRELHKGSKGTDVAQLHSELYRHGCLTDEQYHRPDLKKFTPVTEQAVVCFQRKAGLDPTGRVDACTMVLLKAPQNTRMP